MKYNGIRFKTRLGDIYIIKASDKEGYYDVIKEGGDKTTGRWKEQDLGDYLDSSWTIIEEFKEGDKVVIVQGYPDGHVSKSEIDYTGKEATYIRLLIVNDEGFMGCKHLVKFGVYDHYAVTEVKKIEEKMEKKFIGYKCPYDLFKGRIKRGEIFSKYSQEGFVMYSENYRTSGIATEIVHTWEPVYEEIYTPKVGDWVVYTGSSTNVWYKNRVFQIKEINSKHVNSEVVPMDKVGAVSLKSVRKATEEDIKKEDEYIKSITFNGYSANIKDNMVYFGCKSFTKNDIESYIKLIEAFDYNNLIINSNIIKFEHLARLYNKLK